MENPLQRPDGQGLSRAKLTALAALAWPFIEPYLNSGALDPGAIRRAAPWVFGGLAVYYIRASIRGKPPDLDKLLDGYQSIHARLTQAQAAQVEAETELRLRRGAEPATVVPDREDQPLGPDARS